MTDREMLEMAAKAVGFIDDNADEREDYGLHRGTDGVFYISGDFGWREWNPLTDDGDALRLAVTCGVHLTSSNTDAWASTVGTTAIVPLLDDPYAATRRAITMAAAEIGKAMP